LPKEPRGMGEHFGGEPGIADTQSRGGLGSPTEVNQSREGGQDGVHKRGEGPEREW